MVVPAYAGALNPQAKRETALITGASGGIGLDLARLMAREFDLVLSARNQPRLEQIAGELQQQHGNHVHVVPADLARPEAPEQIFSEIKRRGLRVDALINNAGFGGYGAFADTPLQAELEMLQVNITSLTHLTKLALPGMLEQAGAGHERRLNCRVSARTADGGLLRNQGLCDFFLRGHCQ
jgi:short-subunit dehydrogenase